MSEEIKETELLKDLIGIIKSILDNTDIDIIIRNYYRSMVENLLIK